ncbi:hypothetical protein LOTGIDRAFT_212346 [Lottia gigantea]|uniref:Beta-mannosidase n=1 Tax=Lottia gigantea TaxID=225164 RepID=V4B5N6_LOTGI|nr:hypothetical protein LOTGIDRAFT_212346 [Lottia gigantea]ESP02846.1 hypothetical protein LOTGIDRAFT_212346 [Lottia gigantea]
MSPVSTGVLFLSLILSVQQCIGDNTLNLNGRWDIINSNKGYRVSGIVPGSIYTALIANKTIDDPYYRDNDVQYKWIGRDDWTYTRLFEVSADVLSKQAVILVAEGVDTFSTVTINGIKIGVTDNMFLRYVFDVKAALKSGLNNITIAFKSAVNMAAELEKQSAYPIPPGCPNPAQHGECYRNFIRKEQCSFSWDWGPSFPGQGIWRNISIQYFNEAVVRGVSALPELVADNSWVIHIVLHMDISNLTVSGIVQTTLDKTGLYHEHLLSGTISSDIYYDFTVPKETSIDLWWPNGYGEQTLYNLTVKYVALDGKSVITEKSIKIGFRTIELVQESVSKNASQGLTFYFKINDVPVFLKGTNWIPADSFLERVTKTRLERLLRSAAEVHINSMRVWGGGVYESEEFYELCDELGIMLWHDLMFSDALYPTTPEFLSSVQLEIQHQVERLKSHPSILLWSGNNENEGMVIWYVTLLCFRKSERYKKDYVTLYVDTIKPIVESLDTSRPFVVSSPSNGAESEKEGWISKNAGSEYYGDDHYYNYNADLWNFNTFPIPRLASEFGSEAWCNYETIEKVFAEADLDYNSEMANHRQHHQNGNEEMLNQTAMHISLPTSSDQKQKFQDLIYVIQIHQAMAIRTEAEHYRRYTNQLGTDGRGLTMGTLYWQLNDIWQAPTWASIDYDMKWKMLHYYAKKFYDPNLISPYIDGNNLTVYLVLDEIPVYRDWTSDTQQLNQTSGCIFEKNVDDILSEAGCTDKKNCFLYFYLNSRDNPTSTSWLPLSYFTDVQGRILQSNIQISNVETLSLTEFTVTLTTNHIAPFVWINSRGISGRFSDNGFIMKDPQLQLIFTSWQPVDLKTFTNSLSVQSLMDIYH